MSNHSGQGIHPQQSWNSEKPNPQHPPQQQSWNPEDNNYISLDLPLLSLTTYYPGKDLDLGSPHIFVPRRSLRRPINLQRVTDSRAHQPNSVLHRHVPRQHIRRRRRLTLPLILSRILQLPTTNSLTPNRRTLLLPLPTLRHNHLAWLQYTLRFKAPKILTIVCLLHLLLVLTNDHPTCTLNLRQDRKWSIKPPPRGSERL
ncbi:Hypothetical protein PENO1_049720 [Penicillium occitanis (nom. inval.)]|nr:Hypothetical protein PENO1_049720 [Penicillium occitanis (nom. inval.)]PCH06130.1 hypothetical protein PENOC_025370 [Penicillium occitanis (nom. inval.)]